MHDGKSETETSPVLIIPAAGKSSRFPNMKPKWMLTHPSGKLMIQKVVDGLSLDQYSKIYIVILQEHCDKYEADIILSQAFLDDRFEVVVLDKATNSSPETVYRCIQQKQIDGWVVVKDCDCLVSFEKPKDHNRFVVGWNIKEHPNTKNLPQKSFIISDANYLIQEVIEKEVVSNTICLGVYAMHTSDIVSSYEKMSKILDKELYFSHIVSFLIEHDSKPFLVSYASRFEDWGTRDEWFSSSNLKKTYFFDIDGVLVKNTGKYGKKNWYNTLEPIEDNVSEVKRLSDEGHEIVFVTSRTEDALILVTEFLSTREIKYKTILSGCLHSKRIVVNDFAPSNPFPSCLAINIPRNELLCPYLK